MAKFEILCLLVVCVVAISAKPVKQAIKAVKYQRATTTTTTTEAPAVEEPSGMFAAMGGQQMSCDEWMDAKLATSGMTMEDLATAIVEPQHRDLALEFLLFCMMDETPMVNRQNVLQDEIRKASAVVAVPKL